MRPQRTGACAPRAARPAAEARDVRTDCDGGSNAYTASRTKVGRRQAPAPAVVGAARNPLADVYPIPPEPARGPRQIPIRRPYYRTLLAGIEPLTRRVRFSGRVARNLR